MSTKLGEKSICEVDVKGFFRDRLPILKWIRNYRLTHLRDDFIAGIIIGFTAIPQSLGLATLAGLSQETGLYSAFVGSFVFLFLGTSKDITIGPTPVPSLLTAAYAMSPIRERDPTYAIVLALCTGVIQLLMGIFNLGFVIDFISFTTVSAFKSACALHVIMNQIQWITGIKGLSRDPKTIVVEVLQRLWFDTKVGDLLLGLGCVGVLVSLKELQAWKPFKVDNTRPRKLVNLGWRMFAITRTINVLITATVISYVVYQNTQTNDSSSYAAGTSSWPNASVGAAAARSDQPGGQWSTVSDGQPNGSVPFGSYGQQFAASSVPPNMSMSLAANATALPPQRNIFEITISAAENIRVPTFKVPNFTIADGNVTLVSTADIFARLAEGIVVMPIACMAEHLSIGRLLALRNNYYFDVRQELLAMGTTNVIGSFLQNYPVTGSYGRSIVNSFNQVKTPMFGLWAGCLILLTLGLFARVYYYFPLCCRGACIATAVAAMIDFTVIPAMWRVNKLDLLPYSVTFLIALLWNVNYGLIIGTIFHLLMMVYPIARLKVRQLQSPDDTHLEPVQSIRYLAGDYFFQLVMERADGYRNQVLHIDLRTTHSIDYSTLEALENLTIALQKKQVTIKYIQVSKKVQEKFQHYPNLKNSLTDIQCSSISTIPTNGVPEGVCLQSVA